MVGKKEKEKAFFEAGIKLGALFHQFIGMPVSIENAELIEKAMASSILLQPYVVSVVVRIDKNKLNQKLSEFGYASLDAELIYARVKVRVGKEEVTAVLEWDEKKRYPLMRIEEVV
jgi:hypothetical protein